MDGHASHKSSHTRNSLAKGSSEPKIYDLQDLRRNLATIIKATTVIPFKFSSNTYKCFFCEARFVKTSELQRHTRAEHEGYYRPMILQNALTTYEVKLDITDLACTICAENYDKYDDLIDHLAAKHRLKYNKDMAYHFVLFKLNDDVIKCLSCEEEFQHFWHLLKHITKEHTNCRFMCENCGRGFGFPDQLKRHIKKHTERKPMKCRLCTKTFASITNKRSHEVRVHKIDTYTCEVCNEEFLSVYKLKRHVLHEHNKGDVHSCDQCPRKFIWKNHLIRHKMNMHSGKTEPCPVCGMAFKLNYIKLHMVSHSDEKPFECGVCRNRFARRKTLKVHEKTHTKTSSESL